MQVHLPVYDPSELLVLCVFHTPDKVHKARLLSRAVRHVLLDDATLLGKLRLRLSTLQPWVSKLATMSTSGHAG